MKKQTYEAIKLEWGKISSAEQRALIYHFLACGGQKENGSWMEFLRCRFGLLDTSLKIISKGSTSARRYAC